MGNKTINQVDLPKNVPLTLNQMFLARKALSNIYFDKGVVDLDYKFPLLNEPHYQEYIRKEMGYLQEEIFEAVAELEHSENVETIHEEHADVLHFWLEILLFSGIDYHWVKNYTDKLIDEQNLALRSYETLEALITLARCAVIAEGYEFRYRISIIENWRLGNYKITEPITDRYLIKSLKHLNIARNQLKNKPWKNKKVDTDLDQYLGHLMEGFLNYLCYLSIYKYEGSFLAKKFLQKNIINIERLNG